MLSLTQFRVHCMPLFRVMSDSRMELEIVYKGKVYDMSVTETNKVPKLVRGKRVVPAVVRQVDVANCPECGSLTFNNICMRTGCCHATGNLQMAADTILEPPAPEPEK